jgi:adenosylcobinamide-phosphate synthase
MISIIALAHLLDFLYPYHRGLMLKIHPVHTAYVLALRLGKPCTSKANGVAVWLIVVSLHIPIYSMALLTSCAIGRWLWIIVSAYILKLSISFRLLLDIVGNVGTCIEKGDTECARYWTQQIVRRDVYKLDKRLVASAAIESLAESLVDGYTSPIFYFAIGGPLAALLQRLANTLDGALGFKHGCYKDVGWFSAKADTILNFLPARLTALFIVMYSFLAGRSAVDAYHVWRRDCRKTESVNAGHPMSAMAGALGVELEKPGFYRLGNPVSSISESKAIRIAIKIAIAVATTFTTLMVLANVITCYIIIRLIRCYNLLPTVKVYSSL